MTDFISLGLEPRLLKALAQEGYETPTPIQVQAIPHVLEGKDLLGIAQTGTGKTAGFALPILQRLAADKRPAAPKTARALILSPTRELAAQIADSFRAYGRFMNMNVTTVFGGVSEYAQKQTMAKGIDVLVATPGRLLDLVHQRAVDLTKTEVFVLDEADRMLDMGFINDIRKLVAHLPRQRQNLFFSATMPQEIGALADDLLKSPVSVSVTPQSTTVEKIAQRVVHVDNGSKRALLIELLRTDKDMNRVLVFTRTKHGADKVVRALEAAAIVCSAIHGNKSQSQRIATLNAFRAGRTRVLLATDIAARGIDVDGITHVINFDLPHVPEAYVHRIGRTARAGAEGIAIAFCDREERSLLRDIEKVTRQQIPASDWKAPAQAAGLIDVRPEREPRRENHRQGPRNDKPRGDRPHRDRPRGDRPHGDRQHRAPHGERAAQHPYAAAQPAERAAQPQRTQPHAERPRGDRPHGERPHGDRPHSAKPHGKPHSGKPHGAKSEARSHESRPHESRPHGAKSEGRPHDAKPHTGRPVHTHKGERATPPEGARQHQGPKPHRKGQNSKGAQAPSGNNMSPSSLPRFLQRKATRH